MVKGASLNVECNLYKEITSEDHIMFIGEVIDAVHNPKKQPWFIMTESIGPYKH